MKSLKLTTVFPANMVCNYEIRVTILTCNETKNSKIRHVIIYNAYNSNGTIMHSVGGGGQSALRTCQRTK